MERIINWFRGRVRLRVVTAAPERFLNMCAERGIAFSGVRVITPTELELCVTPKGSAALSSLRGRGFEITGLSGAGAPYTAKKLRRRCALLLGVLLAAAAVWSSSLFIWDISVEGNEAVRDWEILNALDALGVRPGAFGPSIDSERLSNEMLLRLHGLSWFAINVSGSRASVLVRERVLPPEITKPDEPSMVYAKKGGVITDMSVLDGTAMHRVGDTVSAGDVLVSGFTESVSGAVRLGRAAAEVQARTWYELTAEMPVRGCAKAYTGSKRTKTAVILGGRRINLYLNSGIVQGSYDKITKITKLALPTGGVLPVSIVRETYAEYERTPADVPAEEAETILREKLLASLRDAIGSGEIIETQFDAAAGDGTLRVTLRAECSEQIAAVRKPTQEELLP